MEAMPATWPAHSEGLPMSPANHPHVLAINESEDVLQLFHDLLEGEGYRVSTQTYIHKDLDAISQQAPDVIILDYMWAQDDSGWSLLQMLRMSPTTRRIPIVLCTGAVVRVRELDAHLASMDVRVVFKPFDIVDLLAALRDALGEDVASEGEPA
jgi:CheY-like chemotaxis protein